LEFFGKEVKAMDEKEKYKFLKGLGSGYYKELGNEP